VDFALDRLDDPVDPANDPLLAKALAERQPSRSSNSRGCSIVDPTLKDFHSLRWPGAVARHRAILHPFQDGGGVRTDVVEGPEIKRPFHGLPIMLPEERLDVGCEADRVVVRWSIHGSQVSAVGAQVHPPHGARDHGTDSAASGRGRSEVADTDRLNGSPCRRRTTSASSHRQSDGVDPDPGTIGPAARWLSLRAQRSHQGLVLRLRSSGRPGKTSCLLQKSLSRVTTARHPRLSRPEAGRQ
jgi:hypothetical protein